MESKSKVLISYPHCTPQQKHKCIETKWTRSEARRVSGTIRLFSAIVAARELDVKWNEKRRKALNLFISRCSWKMQKRKRQKFPCAIKLFQLSSRCIRCRFLHNEEKIEQVRNCYLFNKISFFPLVFAEIYWLALFWNIEAHPSESEKNEVRWTQATAKVFPFFCCCQITCNKFIFLT